MANYLKLMEVAHRLGISERTARRYVQRGELPSVYVGGSYRVRDEDLGEYLRRAEVKHTPNAEGPAGPETSAAESGFTVAFRQIEDGWWFARCMEVPEAITQGETLEEARENIRDAIELILEDRREEAERDLSGEEGVVRERLAL
jgi:excisionase family DNA binding protein